MRSPENAVFRFSSPRCVHAASALFSSGNGPCLTLLPSRFSFGARAWIVQKVPVMRLRTIGVTALSIGAGAGFAASLPPLPANAVTPAVPLAVQPFDLADVRLLDGPFRDAMQRDLAYLLQLDPDRLLHTFRFNVNLPTMAEPYGGWEGPDVELRGHTMGHYLTACALMYRSTGNEELKRRVDYLVTELARCQAASPAAGFHEGYLSAFPESFIDRVENLKPVWAPWYTLHKVIAGLLDAHQLAGNAQALDMLKKMADWVKLRVDALTAEQMQASLQTEFGGMNEVLANLHAATGDPDHLRLAQAFNHAAVFAPLLRREDVLTGLHANTQIPKVIGAARQYELTGDDSHAAVARIFWWNVAKDRSYVIGGHSDREHFFPVTDFAQHLSPQTTETCNTYNMLKLTRHLFMWNPHQDDWMDFYERGLYNHILASQDPALGRFVYLMSLEPGTYKTYSTAENSFWCCVGTGMENHAKYGDTIFLHNEHSLWVNLFIPAEVNWRERGVMVRQETRFPEEDTTRLVITCREPTRFDLKIRHPGWTRELMIAVNGADLRLSTPPGSYVPIIREWHDGDVVDVRFPMSLHVETLPGVSDTVALLYGPIVLAGQLGQEDMPSPYVRNQLDQARFPHPEVPAFVTEATDSSSSWLSRVEMISRSPMLFRTRGLAQPRDVMLAPFFQTHQQRHAVYWRVLTPDAWAEHTRAVAAVQEQLRALESAATDRVQPGDEVSEAAHGFAGDETLSGAISGRGWREAQKGGAFSYRLNTAGQEALSLLCVYGSRDTACNFTVMIDGSEVAAPKPDGRAPGEIFFEQYLLPPGLLRGKSSVTVTFQSFDRWDGATASVFGCALVPTDP